jgi:hypothetical protein
LLESEKERQQEEEEEDTTNQPQPSASQLTAKRLAQAFDHISAAIVIFEEDDPNMDRSFLVERQVMGCVSAYQEILREKTNKTTQTTLDSFFSKRFSMETNQPSTSSGEIAHPTLAPVASRVPSVSLEYDKDDPLPFFSRYTSLIKKTVIKLTFIYLYIMYLFFVLKKYV